MAASAPRLGNCRAAGIHVRVCSLVDAEDAHDSPALAEPEEEVALKKSLSEPQLNQHSIFRTAAAPVHPSAHPEIAFGNGLCSSHAPAIRYTQMSCSVSGLRPSAHVLKGTCAFHRTWRLAMALSLRTRVVLHLQAGLPSVWIQFGFLAFAKCQNFAAQREGVLPCLQPNIVYNIRRRA